MANTTIASANRVQQWTKKFFSEYVRESRFSSQMGTNENAVIQSLEDLTKKAGDRLTVPLVRRLTNTGVVDDATLEGNEESLTNYGHQLTLHAIANAVRAGKMERFKSPIDILEASRQALKSWVMDNMRTKIIDALESCNVDGVTAYASCSEAQKDAWAVANSDRLLYGSAKSNYSGDNSADLAKVDSTNDKLTGSVVSTLKRIAQSADPHIKPIRLSGGAEVFVLYTGLYGFRDLKSNLQTLLSNADVRGSKNHLFAEGDLMWDSVIVKCVPEINSIGAVGASSIAVEPVFLCGAQAVGLAWGQRSKFVTKKFDYDRQVGVCLDEVRGVEKLMNNSIQNGVVTGFVSGVVDA